MRTSMVVTFTKVRGAPAVHRWPDGTAATGLTWTSGLPHDMGHWFMEAQVDLPYGFWALAARQAPFSSLTLVEGRWPKGKQEWFDKLRRSHGLDMLHAEAKDGAFLADPDLDVRGRWPELKALLGRMYTFGPNPFQGWGPHDVERLRPFALEAAATWHDLPAGGSVDVTWPGANLPVVVDTDERGYVSLVGRGVVQAVAHERDRDGTPIRVRVDIDQRAPRRRPGRRSV